MKIVAVALALLLPVMAALPPGVDRGKVLGSPTAPVVMEIYSSFDCPHCKVLHEELLPRLVKDYVTPGKLCIISREFPLWGAGHPYARQAADYATAAARIGKYEPVADALFKSQATWGMDGKVWEAVASVLTLSEQKKVQALAKDPTVDAEVQKDLEQGSRDGINQTPSVYMSAKGKRFPLPPGVPNYELLQKMIDAQLK